MAGKSHVDVNERRLRPVYDALDSLNNKLAIQLADKILKKQKNLLCAKALKALGLVRSGRSSESTTLLDEIKEHGSFDDSTLQAMTICYREMQRSDMIPSLYEIAVKQNPKNEEFLTHLFMGYVRVGNYVKQQQVAMNLYKVHAKNPYYFWSVMSIFMQALTSKDEKSVCSVLLPLAERMVTKFVKEDKIEAEAEVHLYLMILEKAGKYAEALEVLSGNLGAKLTTLSYEKSELEIDYLKRLDRWPEVKEKYELALDTYPDEWSYYRGLLELTFGNLETNEKQLCNGSESDSVHGGADIDAVEDFLRKKIQKYPSFRGPRLAMLYFLQRTVAKHHRSYSEVREKLYDLMVEYYDKFGGKQCCFSDLTLVCDALSEEDKRKLMRDMMERLPKKEEEVTTEDGPLCLTVENVNKEICMECLKRRMGLHSVLDVNEKLSLAKSLLKRHKEFLSLGKSLLPTELQYADPMALLAAYIFMDIHTEQGGMLWHLLLVLEETVQHSPSNHQMKLLLIHLYSSVGAFGPCTKLYEEIEMKYIMLDTLGYRLTRYAQPSGSFQAASSLYAATLKFFSGNQKDTPEQLISAYKFGSFRKIPEIINFKNRLDNSLHFLTITLEKLHLDLLMQVNSASEMISLVTKMELLDNCPAPDSSLTNLMDNRDYTVLDCFEAQTRRVTSHEKEMSKRHEVLWIRLRSCVLRIVALGCSFFDVNSEEKENRKDVIKKFEEEVAAFTKLNDECCSNEDLRHCYPVHGPPSSRIPIYCQTSHSVFVNCCECIVDQWKNEDQTGDASELKAKLKKISTAIKGDITDISSGLTKTSGDTVMFNGCILEKITCLLETFNWMAILLGVALRLGAQKHGLKRGKKKKGTQSSAPAESNYVVYTRECLQDSRDALDGLLKALKSTQENLIDKELDQDGIDKLFEKTQSAAVAKIWENIQSSYRQSLLEIDQLMELKLNFVDSLMKHL